MIKTVTIIGTLFSCFFAYAQEGDYPKIHTASDTKASLTYFQAVDSALKSHARAFRFCLEKTEGATYRYSRFQFLATLTESGSLQLDRDVALKTTNQSWQQMPEKYRAMDTCLQQQLLRVAVPKNEQPVDISIELDF